MPNSSRNNTSIRQAKSNSNDYNEVIDSDMWSQFENFRKWHEDQKLKKSSLASSSLSDDEMPLILEKTLTSSPHISVTKTSTNASATESRTRKTLKARRAPRTQNIETQTTHQTIISSNICDQTLNQPLNPNIFLRGALKSFRKSRNQIANTKNTRRYPQISNDSLNKLASTFMVAPTQEILALMHDGIFPKDFNIEHCKSSSEYLFCLLGFGIHQTLNFPIMGVFYLELVRLILKHMDRFSSNEEVKLSQVRDVCEDILTQNSVRDDFLPIEIMEASVDKVVNRKGKIQQLFKAQGDKENKNSQNQKAQEDPIIEIGAEKKTNDELGAVLLVDVDEDEQIALSLGQKSQSCSQSSSSSIFENKINPDFPLVNDVSRKRKATDASHIIPSGVAKTIKLIDLEEEKETAELISPQPSPNLEISTPFTRPFKIPNDLANLLGVDKDTRLFGQEVVKKLWVYIKQNKLQDPNKSQYFTPDKAMEPIFGKEKIGTYAMVKSIETMQINQELKESLTKKLKSKGVSLEVNIGSKHMNTDNFIDLSSDSETETSNISDIPDIICDVSPEQINLSSEKTVVSTEKTNLSSEKTSNILDIPEIICDISPEKIDFSSEKTAVSTEKINLLSEKTDVSPEKINLSSEKINLSSEKITVSPEKINLPPKKINEKGKEIRKRVSEKGKEVLKRKVEKRQMLLRVNKSNPEDNKENYIKDYKTVTKSNLEEVKDNGREGHPNDLKDLCDFIRNVKKEILSPTNLPTITEFTGDSVSPVLTPDLSNSISDLQTETEFPGSKSDIETEPEITGSKSDIETESEIPSSISGVETESEIPVGSKEREDGVESDEIEIDVEELYKSIDGLSKSIGEDKTNKKLSSSQERDQMPSSHTNKNANKKESSSLKNKRLSSKRQSEELSSEVENNSSRNKMLNHITNLLQESDDEDKSKDNNVGIMSQGKDNVHQVVKSTNKSNKVSENQKDHISDLLIESDDEHKSENNNIMRTSPKKKKVSPPRSQMNSSEFEDDLMEILEEEHPQYNDDTSVETMQEMALVEEYCNDCFAYFNSQFDLKKHECIGKAEQIKQGPNKSIADIQFEQSGLSLESDTDSEDEEDLSSSFDWSNI